jgi:hypothetical protein
MIVSPTPRGQPSALYLASTHMEVVPELLRKMIIRSLAETYPYESHSSGMC